MMDSNERAFKGIWIPKEIWLNDKLSLQEKVFLVEIDSLDNDEGCFASNDHFSNFFGLSKGRCSEIINSLKSKGLISISFTYQEGNKAIDKRIIKCIWKNEEAFEKEVEGYSENKEGVFGKGEEGYSEKAKDNNTIINNTIINKKKESKKETYDDIINENFDNDKVKETLLEFIKMRKLIKKPLTDFALKKICNKLKELSSNNDEQINILEQSIMNNWQGIFPLKNELNKSSNKQIITQNKPDIQFF